MRFLRKAVFAFELAFFLSMMGAPQVFAANPGIIPLAPDSCISDRDLQEQNAELFEALREKDAFDAYVGPSGNEEVSRRQKIAEVLGCAVKLGRTRLYMLPFFITYLTQTLLAFSGIIAVAFVVYGGYQYTIGGLIEDKESGKKTILHALVGLIVSVSAWMIVNFVQIALTS